MSNSTTITGNLTREPEIRYTRDGQATTLLGVAVNRRWQDKETREWEEATSFFDVVCWRDLAENAAVSLAKGMRVMVTGRLEQRNWETEDGERRSKVEIVAEEVGPSLRFATADVQRAERRAPAPDGDPADIDDEVAGPGTGTPWPSGDVDRGRDRSSWSRESSVGGSGGRGSVAPVPPGSSASGARVVGSNSSDNEFTQYRSPVSVGPSGNTWPRWPPQRPQMISVRRMPKLRSSCSSTRPSATDRSKLGQPEPESNLASEENSSAPQPAHTNIPSPSTWSRSPGTGPRWPPAAGPGTVG